MNTPIIKIDPPETTIGKILNTLHIPVPRYGIYYNDLLGHLYINTDLTFNKAMAVAKESKSATIFGPVLNPLDYKKLQHCIHYAMAIAFSCLIFYLTYNHVRIVW